MEIRESLNPVYSTGFIRQILGAYAVAPGAELLDTPTVHLFKDEGVEPDANTPQADFDDNEADFTDYAAAALTIIQPVNLGDETEAATGTVTFTISDPGAITGNTVYGYWVEVAGDWVIAERFPEGEEVQMAADADQLVLTIKLPVAARPLGS